MDENKAEVLTNESLIKLEPVFNLWAQNNPFDCMEWLVGTAARMLARDAALDYSDAQDIMGSIFQHHFHKHRFTTGMVPMSKTIN